MILYNIENYDQSCCGFNRYMSCCGCRDIKNFSKK